MKTIIESTNFKPSFTNVSVEEKSEKMFLGEIQ